MVHLEFCSVCISLDPPNQFIIATILEIIQLSRSLSSPQSTSLNSVLVIFSVLNVPPNLFFWNLFSKWLLQLATLPLIFFFSARFPLDSLLMLYKWILLTWNERKTFWVACDPHSHNLLCNTMCLRLTTT